MVVSSCCHTLRGCVDWNTFISFIIQKIYKCHTLRGCVDWNIAWIIVSLAYGCHTLRGCVDWNIPRRYITKFAERHTLRGCVDWNRKQILFSEPTWKSHFYEKVPLIVNKLQRQKIWFGTFLSGLSFSIIQQTLVISVQNVSPPATAFVSSCHSIRLLRSLYSTPSAIAFDSISHCIRLLQLMQPSPSANSAVSFC